MRCVKPNLVGKVEYPCLKCVSCAESGRSELAQRIKLELASHPWSVFVTATFRPEDYPANRKDLERKFRRIWRGVPYRVFALTERGDRGGRIHVHAISFGQSPLGAADAWVRQWPYGFVKCKEASAGSARYLAAYMLKGDDAEAMEFHPDGFGRPIVHRVKKPPLGCFIASRMVATELADAQRRWLLSTTQDVPAVHRMDGFITRTPRAVRVAMRRQLGMPSSSAARERVQAERRRWLSENPDLKAASERRRKALAVADGIKASRARSSRVYRDPNLTAAEKSLAAAVAAGTYETRAMRRRRLALEREIEGAADALLQIVQSSATKA